MSVEIIYWDSDAFLGHLQEEVGKVELCAGTLQRAEGGEVVIITSALTITEVLWMRNAPRITADKADVLRKFFRRSIFRVQNVTRSIAEMAQDLVWNNDIRPKDALHVATAISTKAPILETFDEGLLKKTGLVGSPPLIIRKPQPPKQPKLL